GLFATAIVGFGRRLVSGRSRVPRPAARISPFMLLPLQAAGARADRARRPRPPALVTWTIPRAPRRRLSVPHGAGHRGAAAASGARWATAEVPPRRGARSRHGAERGPGAPSAAASMAGWRARTSPC